MQGARLEHALWRLLGRPPRAAESPLKQGGPVLALPALPAPAADRRLIARQRLAAAFTPTRPIEAQTTLEGTDGDGPFVGRGEELERIRHAFEEDRAHVVLYGERGRGKTSLANRLLARARLAGFDVGRFTCSATSGYDAIMRGLLGDLPRWLVAPGAGGGNGHGIAEILPPSRPLWPADILAALGRLQWTRLLLVVDEFDRVPDDATRTAIADTIKQLSDRGLPIYFLIVGVSDGFEELFGSHPSIQRCLTRVALPLLTPEEVRRLVAWGGSQAGLTYSSAAQEAIALLARGMPYVAQLLALRAGQAAIERAARGVEGQDLRAAVGAAAVEADPRVLLLFDSLTRGGMDAAVLRVLLAGAAGARDRFGRFRLSHDGARLRLAGAEVDPAAWERVRRSGAIRESRSGEPGLFTFNEATLPHLVLQRMLLRQAPGVQEA